VRERYGPVPTDARGENRRWTRDGPGTVPTPFSAHVSHPVYDVGTAAFLVGLVLLLAEPRVFRYHGPQQ